MGLTADEDEELRRIHVLSQFGELPETMRSRFNELRARDDRSDIPEPILDIQWVPQQRRRGDAMDSLLNVETDVEVDMDADDADALDEDLDELATYSDELADFDWVLVRKA
jgi:hypothetical protein